MGHIAFSSNNSVNLKKFGVRLSIAAWKGKIEYRDIKVKFEVIEKNGFENGDK